MQFSKRATNFTEKGHYANIFEGWGRHVPPVPPVPPVPSSMIVLTKLRIFNWKMNYGNL